MDRKLTAADLRRVGIDSFELNPDKIRDISPEVLDADGRMRVLPASYWAGTTMQERALFGNRNAIYGFPTAELVQRLTEIIDGRSAIEIGAGHGVLAEALGIRATDSRQQDDPRYAAIYRRMGNQPTVKYGANVQTYDAQRAVSRYKPKVVIGCWITHKWDRRHPEREGNEAGINEADIISRCETFVLVGNEHVHRNSRVWDFEPEVEYPDYVYSRANNLSRDFIAVVNRSTR